MPSTPTRQRNAASEGLALGLVLAGCTRLPYRKTELDLALVGAWNSWTHRTRFPQVNTDLVKGLDPIHAFTRADARKNVLILHWELAGAELRILTRQPDWAPDDPTDVAYAVSMIDEQVPAEAWQALAEGLLTRYAHR